MLIKLGIATLPEASSEVIIDIQQQEESQEAEDSEVETDEDVLSLPAIPYLTAAMNLWTPGPLSKSAELAIKRAVISGLDLVGTQAGRLEVEDIVAQAADSAPISGHQTI